MPACRIPGLILLATVVAASLPRSQDPSGTRLRDRVDAAGLAEALRAIDREGVPGACAFGVLRLRPDAGPGEDTVETWIGVAGSADAEGRRPVHRGTLFPLGSVSRAAVVLAALEAVDAGRLDPATWIVSSCGPATGPLSLLTGLTPLSALLDGQLFGECFLRIPSSKTPPDLRAFLREHRDALSVTTSSGPDDPGIALLARALARCEGRRDWAEAVTRGVGRRGLFGLVARPHLSRGTSGLARFDAEGRSCEDWRGGFPAAFDVWGTPRSALRVAEAALRRARELPIAESAARLRAVAEVDSYHAASKTAGLLWEDDLPGQSVRLVVWPRRGLAVFSVATGPAGSRLREFEARIARAYGAASWPFPPEVPGLAHRGKWDVPMRLEAVVPIGGRSTPVVVFVDPSWEGRRVPRGSNHGFQGWTWDMTTDEAIETMYAAEFRVGKQKHFVRGMVVDGRRRLSLDLGEGVQLAVEVYGSPFLLHAVLRLEIDGVQSVPYPARVTGSSRDPEDGEGDR